jgi:predicted acylesterase/phospholipase RssA
MPHGKSNKTALVLAGGGLTGAVYEIGALRAIDDLLIDLTVNDFDIYVGTSAGALICSYLANGVSPEEMLGVIDGSNKQIASIERQHIFRLNRREYLRWGLNLPQKVIHSWSHYLLHFYSMTLFDLVWTLGDILPNGFYDSMGLENYVCSTLRELGLPNEFDMLSHELYIIATELDTGDRAVFGNGHIKAPISHAVAASSALPMVYRPIEVDGKEYIDGGMRGAASIDLAIECGANLIVCINPLVPFDYTSQGQFDEHTPQDGHLSKRGIQAIAGQTMRIFSHASLHYHIKQLRRAHPQVDIILIEPKPDDFQMFFYNIMHYSSRLLVAQHGFESVTFDLATDYEMYKEILARHAIRITRRLVIEELQAIEQANHDPEVIRQVLQASRVGCRQRHPMTPVCQLSRILAELEGILEDKKSRLSAGT